MTINFSISGCILIRKIAIFFSPSFSRRKYFQKFVTLVPGLQPLPGDLRRRPEVDDQVDADLQVLRQQVVHLDHDVVLGVVQVPGAPEVLHEAVAATVEASLHDLPDTHEYIFEDT
jgi:hypothetical protein